AGADMAAARVKPAAPGATGAGVVPGERVLECRAGMSVTEKSEGKSITYSIKREALPACCRAGSPVRAVFLTCICTHLSPINRKEICRMPCARQDCVPRPEATKLAVHGPQCPLLNRLAHGNPALEESAR